jgi:hypothetical protein
MQQSMALLLMSANVEKQGELQHRYIYLEVELVTNFSHVRKCPSKSPYCSHPYITIIIIIIIWTHAFGTKATPREQ